MLGLLERIRDEMLHPVNEANLQMRAEQLRTRLRLIPTGLAGQSVLVMLLLWILWDAVPHNTLLLWALATYVVYAADLVVWLLFHKRTNTVRECTRWHFAFVLFTAAGGLMWGSTAIWIFPADQIHQALLIMIMLGLAAASVTANPSYPSAFYIYILCVVLPHIIRSLSVGDADHAAMSLIMILYLLVVLKAGNELGRAFHLALQQRHENMALVRQLTEQKALAEQARRQVEAASNEKNRFLAAASHDLRQPLQALTLFSEALQGCASDKKVVHLAEQIESSVHALGDMFDELLDLSRLDAGMMAPQWRHFSLQPLLDRLYVNFAALAQVKGLGFEIPVGDTSSGGDIVVYSDPFFLERILRNLVSNAIRYTDTGKVVLNCNSSDDELRLEVVDTGIGIRAEIIPHIFEEYYQADNPHRDRRKGLGLGLAIVSRIEKLLGLRLDVVSEPGKGSTFGFSVPLGNEGQSTQPFAITHSRHDLGGSVVVLIEDDPDIRQITAELMTQWGCRVFAGELPAAAVRELDMHSMRPDLLVCDYRLPQGMTAIHAIRQMRELWGSDIPAMVLTGDTAAETLREIQESGALLLHKPITPARLRSLMYLTIHGD